MKYSMRSYGFIVSTVLATQVKPGPPFIAFCTATPSALISILPFQIKKILLAVILSFKELIKCLN